MKSNKPNTRNISETKKEKPMSEKIMTTSEMLLKTKDVYDRCREDKTANYMLDTIYNICSEYHATARNLREKIQRTAESAADALMKLDAGCGPESLWYSNTPSEAYDEAALIQKARELAKQYAAILPIFEEMLKKLSGEVEGI